jgi:hypothetical protein
VTDPAGPPAPPRRVRLDIGRITLHGYSPAQRQRFIGALEARLAEVAAGTQAAAAGLAPARRLDAGAMPAGAPPEEAAARVAAALRAHLAGGRHA